MFNKNFKFNLISILIFIIFSCDQHIADNDENETQSSFTISYGTTDNCISPDSVSFLDSSASGEHDLGTGIKAIVKNDGMLFDGWYDSPNGGELISRKNPYSFILFNDMNLYAQFIQGPVYPASNSDNYNPGEGWILSWQDEFNNNDFDTNPDDENADNWDRETNTNEGDKRTNNEYQDYTGGEDTAYESDGYLVIKAEKINEEHEVHSYTSARVISNPGGKDGTSGTKGFTFQYGKIAARIQLPYGKGIWPAFWLLGDNIDETGGDTPWPSCGEVDILETGFGNNPDYYYGHAMLGGAIHYDESIDNTEGFNSYNYLTDYTYLQTGIFADNFRVYELEWSSTQMIWRVDGEEFYSLEISDEKFNEFRENFYIILNIAVSGHITDRADDSTNFPATMYVDWVRHYTKG